MSAILQIELGIPAFELGVVVWSEVFHAILLRSPSLQFVGLSVS